MTKTELFLKLAQPDKNGVSRWVSTTEFVGEWYRSCACHSRRRRNT